MPGQFAGSVHNTFISYGRFCGVATIVDHKKTCYKKFICRF